MHLNDDWNEFLRVLTSTGTRYLLIGGHALAVHAQPRFTEDLDVFVQPSLANAKRLRAALVEFGFGSVIPEAAALAKPGLVWMLGRKPRRIDILTGISGVTFAEAERGSVAVTVGASSLESTYTLTMATLNVAPEFFLLPVARATDILHERMEGLHAYRKSRSR